MSGSKLASKTTRFGVLHLDMVPPVLVWTFHGPSAQFIDEDYVDVLSDLAKGAICALGALTSAKSCSPFETRYQCQT